MLRGLLRVLHGLLLSLVMESRAVEEIWTLNTLEQQSDVQWGLERRQFRTISTIRTSRATKSLDTL